MRHKPGFPIPNISHINYRITILYLFHCSCSLSRYSEISDSGQDFDLNESYWIIRGYRLTSMLKFHKYNYSITYNIIVNIQTSAILV